MKHAREDYNRIQDPAGKIPEDEPVFLLRGQDETAYLAVLDYAERLADYGGDSEIVRLATEQAQRMRDWATRKMPDLPSRAQQPPAQDVREPQS